jgi:eukaryotic-like serine/threonine-protein kinase
LRACFDAVIDLPVELRSAWMTQHIDDAELRVKLERMLALDAQVGPFDIFATQRIEQWEQANKLSFDGLIGTRIGAFRIERLLGQGGMATVFLVRRDLGDFEQQVAIKLLRKGLYTESERRLFRREQKALAALTHPNIAYLIDAGITDAGVPFLVLEYVDGVPVTQYATQQSLDVEARLRLFVSICRAVAAAHRQLVVHRDLKPSNILVRADSEVKLLDFGVAKLLDDDAELHTQSGLVALTPAYAAPEQRLGKPISTSTDVYALGILLHELLIGRRPEDDEAGIRQPSSLLALLSDADRSGSSPQVLRQRLRGDLDNILLMALSAEPERRYHCAAEFADDVQRHLDAQPVLAHPPSRWYRAQKFVSASRR